MTALVELAVGMGLFVALVISLAAAAHDDGRPRVAPARIRERR